MRLLLVAVFLVFGCSPKSDSSENSITVFAAASLTDILHEFVRTFELKNPDITVHLHIGPTSLLARQIQQGAPADVFVSASQEWMDYLHEQDLIQGTGTHFAGNTLIVIGNLATSNIVNLSDLTSDQHLAMADPSHVPAGVYGKQALECAGIWDTIESSVIPTLDVRAALTAVVSGAADLAMVYGSDAGLVPELKLMFQVPDSCTPKINYVISILQRTANPVAASAFVAFTADSLHQALFTRFGFRP